MLSRVANHLYWMSRYLERAENTARLIQVNTHLLLDLPKNVMLGWEPIVDILSFRDVFYEKYETADEKSVIRFMVTDTTNPSSIINSLANARENARIVREIIPSESWELINNLHMQAKADAQSVLTRRHRFDCLNKVIIGNQTIDGLFDGTMNRNKAYSFLVLGRHLERADMTSRILDVRTASLLPGVSEEHSAFENIQWMGVLKSLTAYQMYRQEMRLRIRRSDILEFLMKRDSFPKSLRYSLQQAKNSVSELPNHEKINALIEKSDNQLKQLDTRELMQEKLHEVVDDIQADLLKIHDAIDKSYF